ncbi:MAG: phage regulatory CII family protein [Pseudomonadota bacterium]
MSVFARFKRAVREAIAANGKIEGAQRSTGKGSIVGDWNNRHSERLPTLADAYALDDVALIEDGRAPILEALSAELGFVPLRLPEVGVSGNALAIEFAKCAGEFGDVATVISTSLADGELNGREPDAICKEIDEAQAQLAKLRALVLASGKEVQS